MAVKRIEKKESSNEINRFENMDYARILNNALKHWYIFAICFSIAMGVAWFVNKTTIPIYCAGTTVLLKDEGNGGQLYDLTQGFKLASEQRNLENLRYIYTSSKMVSRAITGNGFEVSYYHIGHFIDTEIYGHEVSYRVNFDTLHTQPIGAIFEVNFISQNKVKMHVVGENVSGYSYIAQSNTSFYAQHIDTTFIFNINEKITTPIFSLSIDPIRDWVDTNNHTKFHFNTIQSISAQWSNVVNFNIISGTVASITATGTNLYKIQAFLKGLNYAAVSHNLDKKNETATRTLDFIKRQLGQTADSLNAATERLKYFKQQHGVAARKDYASELNMRYLTYDNAAHELYIKRQNLQNLNNRLNDGGKLEDYFSAAMFDDHPLIQKYVLQMIEIQQELYKMKDENDNNPYKKEVIDNELLLASNMRIIIQQTIETYNQKIDELNKQMSLLSTESDLIPDIETEAFNLERDYKIQDAVYTFLLQKESETLIAKASNTADNEVLQEPFGMGQLTPNSSKNYSTAAAIGLMLPAAFFVLIEFMNNKIRTLKELKKTVPQLSVIGLIPEDNEAGDLPTITMPQSPISESFRTLRTKLKYISADKNIQIIAVSSCNPGEGKTFCAINMAISFAQAGHKCILINYDLRRPRAEKAIGITQKIGITDYLVGNEKLDDIIVHSDIENLDVLPSGTIPPNPSELITSDKNRELIEYLRTQYKTIIIDTAPIGCVADGRPLEKIADAFLFVVRANRTEFVQLKETIDSLTDNDKNDNTLCMLFNGAKHNRREYYRYGNYGYGYGYGYNYNSK